MDAFLTARLDSLTPPDQWPQMPEAAQLLASELLAGKKLAVWGDYDVDGVTAATLVLDVLESHGIIAQWHIPDRRSEGYGLNVPHIEALAAEGDEVSAGAGIIGFDVVATTAEEAKNPARDLPRGIIGSLVICTALYVVVAGVLPTAAGVSPTVSNGEVLFSMIVYTLIYGFLAVIEVWLFLKFAKKGLPDVAPPELQTDPDAPMTFAY